MGLYRSKQQFRTETHDSMGLPKIHVIGVLDNMTYAILNQDDFENNYELIPEAPEIPTEE